MGILNKIKNIFKREDEQPTDIIKEDVVEEPIKEFTGNVCEACGFDIFKEQKIKTFNGKKYHLKPCFRNLFKQGRNLSKGINR